jgi:hypothetical protein
MQCIIAILGDEAMKYPLIASLFMSLLMPTVFAVVAIGDNISEQEYLALSKGYDVFREYQLQNENAVLKESVADKDLAEVVVVVNRADKGEADDAQTMRVYHNGVLLRTIVISTGTKGHATPVGYYRPIYSNHMRIYKTYYSSTYNAAAMDWAVFFNGGIAFHSTPESNYKLLGQRASHGCVRMKMEDVEWLNELVRTTGGGNYVMKKWRHEKFVNHPTYKNRYNEHFSGIEVLVPSISRESGKLLSKEVKSVDTVVIIKDEKRKS